jgi:surface polysaccharide O-acyltransferase-like enzyme
MQTRTAPSADEANGAETIKWVSTARVVSAFAVVLLHSVAHEVNAGPVNSHTAWLVAIGLDAAVRWCVPVFVMLSGFLLLAPSRSMEPAIMFYRRRATKILIPMLAWTIIYISFMWVKSRHSTPTYTISDAASSIIHGTPFYHMWYMFMIACLYGITPLLRRISEPLTTRQFVIAGTACLTGAAIVAAALGEDVNIQPTFLLVFPFYIGYFLVGRAIASGMVNIRFPVAIVAISVAVTAILTVTTKSDYFFGYLSISVLPMSIAAFALLSRVAVPAFDRVSKYMLGVYLAHPIFIMGAKTILNQLPSTPAIAVLVFKTIFAFFAALLFSWSIARIPFLRRII